MTMKIDDSNIARRKFLCSMVGGGAVAMGAGAVTPLASYVANAKEIPLPDSIELEKSEWELEPGSSRKVPYGPIQALLLRTPEDEMKVFVAKCTHLDCPIFYKVEDGLIECPCHFGRFTLDGEVHSPPPTEPLTRMYYEKLSGDKLVIALEEEIVIALKKEDREKAS